MICCSWVCCRTQAACLGHGKHPPPPLLPPTPTPTPPWASLGHGLCVNVFTCPEAISRPVVVDIRWCYSPRCHGRLCLTNCGTAIATTFVSNVGMPHGRQEHMQLLRLEAAMWDSTQLNQNRFRTWWTRLIAMLLVAGAAGVVWAVRPNPQALPVSEVWVLTTGD